MTFLFKEHLESISFEKMEKMRNIYLTNHKWKQYNNIGSDPAFAEEIVIYIGFKSVFPDIREFIVNIHAIDSVNATIDNKGDFKIRQEVLEKKYKLENISKEMLIAEIYATTLPFFNFGYDELTNPFTLNLDSDKWTNSYRLTGSLSTSHVFLFEDEASYYYFYFYSLS